MSVVNGWTLYAHPRVLGQMDAWLKTVKRRKRGEPAGWSQSKEAKLLLAVRKLIHADIPTDPGAAKFRQGESLGKSRRHWFRAKFGNGRYRLFFRFDTAARIIVFAWVNDETTLRTYGSKTDAYVVFRKMLEQGDPPDDWSALIAAASPLPDTDS